MEKDSLPVLSVKYKIPSPRDHYILRKSLLKRLEAMKDHMVTIIKAGAGSGKTTLLSVYIKEQGLENVRWITLDEGMNHVFLFWQYVFGALEPELHGRGQSLKGCFEGGIPKEVLEQMLAVLADSLKKESDIYLVLDDFQYIQDGYILETLDMLLKMMPANLHLIIVTRQLPGIHTGALYMEGKLLVLGEEEMRLSRKECRDFLTYTLNMGDAASNQVEEIIENANGWIGGAQLLAINHHMVGGHRAVFTTADEGVINDYIEKEIFTTLSEEERQFLLKTSVLSYFNEEICGRYLPEYRFIYMIDSVLAKNLFVIQIDEEKKEYSYHAILRGFLLHRLEQMPDQKTALYQRAAEVMYELNEDEECVRLLFEIKAYEILMERLLKMPQNAATFSYMMQVPLEQIVKNPNFAYQYFFCYYSAMEVEACGTIYEYITRHLKTDATFRAFEHADLFFNVNWEFSDIAIMSYEQIESMPLNQVSKAYLLLKEAYFLFLAERMGDAMYYLDQAEMVYKKTSNLYIENFVLSEKAQILEEYGFFKEAFRVYERLAEIIRDVPSMKGPYYIGIAGLHIRQLKLSEAKEELALAKEAIGLRADSISSAYLYTLAEWYYVTGNPKKTEEIIMALAEGNVYQSVFFSARLLRYPIYRGQNKELAIRFRADYRVLPEGMRNQSAELLYAGIEYEEGDKETAFKLVGQVLAKARKMENRTKIVEGTLMKARFLFEQDQDNKSIANLLTEALEYACPECMRLPFWFEKTFLLSLDRLKGQQIRAVLSESRYHFWNSIIKECKEMEKEPESATLPYGLTGREWEVLEEIAEGKTNKMIADKLCISQATVKTHLISIYGKLGVNNRLSAANKMRDSEGC